jgi:hypothetical protein
MLSRSSLFTRNRPVVQRLRSNFSSNNRANFRLSSGDLVPLEDSLWDLSVTFDAIGRRSQSGLEDVGGRWAPGFVDPYLQAGSLSIEAIRNATPEEDQSIIDAHADQGRVQSTYSYNYTGTSNPNPHEYSYRQTLQLSSPNAVTSLLNEFRERPYNIHRLLFRSTAMGAITLGEARATEILNRYEEVVNRRGLIGLPGLPTNQLTDADRQLADLNLRNGAALEPYTQIGSFSIIRNENPRVWQNGDRWYASLTAITTDGHVFAQGVAKHIACIDTRTNLLHFSVIGAGNAPGALLQVANVHSANPLWVNRGQTLAQLGVAADGRPLNTFDTQGSIEQVTGSLDRISRFTRWALQGLDVLSGAMFSLTKYWIRWKELEQIVPNFTLSDGDVIEVGDNIEASYAGDEPIVPQDQVSEVKRAADNIAQANLSSPGSQVNPEEAKQTSNTGDNTVPDDLDPFKAAQDNQSLDDQGALKQEISGPKTPDGGTKPANDGLSDPFLNQRPGEGIPERPVEGTPERPPERPVEGIPEP